MNWNWAGMLKEARSMVSASTLSSTHQTDLLDYLESRCDSADGQALSARERSADRSARIRAPIRDAIGVLPLHDQAGRRLSKDELKPVVDKRMKAARVVADERTVWSVVEVMQAESDMRLRRAQTSTQRST